MEKWLRFCALVLVLVITLPTSSARTDPADPTRALIHPIWAEFTPAFTQHTCPFGSSAFGNDRPVICGYVLVPEDRRDEDSSLIKLSVAVIRGEIPGASGHALVRLTGGPGGQTLAAGRVRYYSSPAARHITRQGDVILFDQRGIGYSETDLCRAVPRVFQYGVPSARQGVDAFAEAMGTCLSEATARGIDIDAYTTWHNAHDVRDIRRALGYDRWTLYGVSYGTALGQAVMLVDPAGVRAAILDSVVPAYSTSTAGWQPTAFGFRSALTALGAACAADRRCRRDIGDLAERLVAAIKSFEADPLIITGLSERAYVNGTLVVDGVTAAGAVFQALYRRDIYGDFPTLLRALETRDAAAIKAYSDALGRPINHIAGNGMELITNCSSGTIAHPNKYAALAKTEPDLSRWMLATDFDELCRVAYKVAPDPSVRRLVSDIPVLLAAGAVDPITPPDFTQYIQDGLSNATYVEFPFTGHGALASNGACGDELIAAFLAAPNEPLDTSCAQKVDAPIFFTRLRETKAPYRFAITLQTGGRPLWPIITALLLSLSCISYPLGALARRIEGRSLPSLGRTRLYAWAGGTLSLAALGLGLYMIFEAGTRHPMALPMGVPTSVALAGWLGLIGLGVSTLSLYELWRRLGAGLQRPGTGLGLIISFGASVSGFIFLLRTGLGPV